MRYAAALALALALAAVLPGRARAQTPTAVPIFPTDPPPTGVAFLPYTRADPPPTATPRPTATAAPTATPDHAPWRSEWRRRTADEVIEQWRRDGLPAVVTSREWVDDGVIHYENVGVRTVGRRPGNAADMIVVDCVDPFSRDVNAIILGWEDSLEVEWHRNIVFVWASTDPRPAAYIASYMAECEVDPHCDPLDPE